MSAPTLDAARLAEIKARPCPWRTTAEDIALLLGEVDRLTVLTDRLTLALADTAERLTIAERDRDAMAKRLVVRGRLRLAEAVAVAASDLIEAQARRHPDSRLGSEEYWAMFHAYEAFRAATPEGGQG